jgi:hypothetical protein
MLNEAKHVEIISMSQCRTPVILQYEMELTSQLVKPVKWPLNPEKIAFG